MAFLTTQRIRILLASDSPAILNPKTERVNNACYEMGLGTEAFITSSDRTKQIRKHGDQVRIPLGQFGLLITEEEIDLPLNILAFISIKASKKMTGLVNVSGFHVDPGFRGKLKFSVYNAGADPIVLDVGKPLFPIWFYELPEENADPYNGRHQGQLFITADDVNRLQGEVASPAALKKDLDDLRATVRQWKAAVIGAVILFGGTFVATLLGLLNAKQ